MLVDRLYRARAFWTAVGAYTTVGIFVGGAVDSIVAPGTGFANNYPGLIAQDIVWALVILPLIFWLVSNINVAISADYFHRDILFWNRGGRYATPGAALTWFVIVSLPQWWFSPSSLLVAILASLAAVLLTAGFVYVGLAMITASVRTKDMEIKRYTRWVALSIVTLLLGIILSGIAPSWVPVIQTFEIVVAYCLYRAAGALAIRTRDVV